MFDNLSERERTLIDLLADDPAATVTRMSEATGVSTVTVRGDLARLEGLGLIVRSRGGASPAFHPEILKRQRHRSDEKHRIARRAAALVTDGDTIMIEAGTTTALIARYLVGKRDVRVVTNSALVIPHARVNPALQLVVLGGTFRPETEAFVGPVALAGLESFHVRLAFVGTDGFTIENGLSSYFPEAAAVLKRMVERADRTVLVADSSKWGRTGFVTITPIASVGTLITDAGLDEDARRRLREAGVEVDIV
jgi:DeoR family transcriptional regulator, galactitol utilization operon repressor